MILEIYQFILLKAEQQILLLICVIYNHNLFPKDLILGIFLFDAIGKQFNCAHIISSATWNSTNPVTIKSGTGALVFVTSGSYSVIYGTFVSSGNLSYSKINSSVTYFDSIISFTYNNNIIVHSSSTSNNRLIAIGV